MPRIARIMTGYPHHITQRGNSRATLFFVDEDRQAGFPLRPKVTTICLIWVSFPTSAVLFAEAPWLKALLIAAAVAISGYLYSLPTAPPNDRQRQPRL